MELEGQKSSSVSNHSYHWVLSMFNWLSKIYEKQKQKQNTTKTKNLSKLKITQDSSEKDGDF